MAFEVKNINPLDLQPRKAVGVSIPFSGTAVFNQTFETKDAIRNNLINFFLTARGERPLNVNFGAGLRNLLFEQLTQDAISNVREYVIEGLSMYFPQVLPTEIRIIPESDRNTVNFYMSYAIENTNIGDEILINFEV